MIDYNGDPFVDQPTPYVSISSEYVYDGTQRIERQVMTLRGELLGCSRAELEGLRQDLADKFKTRENIIITGLGSYKVENVLSVNFSESPLFTKLPYTITLQLKDSSPLIEKSVQVSIQENKDASLTIIRTITASGKDAHGSTETAWNNCKAFIAQEAVKTAPKPILIDSKSYNYFLSSVEEEFDRINSKITLTQTYRCDVFYNFTCVARRRINVEQNSNGRVVSISGEIEFKKNDSAAYAEAKTAADSLMILPVLKEPFEIAPMKIANRTFDIDFQGGRANFSIDYVENKGVKTGEYVNEYSITLEEGADTSLINVSINGVFKINENPTVAKINGLAAAFTSTIINNNYLFSACYDLYKIFFPIGVNTISLKNIPLNTQRSINKDGTRISWSASFDDRYLLADTNYYNYGLQVKPSINQIRAKDSLKNGTYFVDLGYKNRATASINSETVKCIDDLSFNLNDLAELDLRKHIAEDLDSSAKTKIVILEKSKTSANSNRFSTTIEASYDGAEFII